MSADRLAALLHDDPDVCGNPSGIMVHSDEGYCDRIAARLRAAGVFPLTVDRLAAALPDVMDQDSADYVYGQGFDPLDAPQEWWSTPREMAGEILANLTPDCQHTNVMVYDGRCARCGALRDVPLPPVDLSAAILNATADWEAYRHGDPARILQRIIDLLRRG